MIPSQVQCWLVDNGYGEIESSHPVGGGCINNGVQLLTKSGESFFLKTNNHAPEDMFGREVEGLAILNVTDGPRVPNPYLHATNFLLMEDLSPSARMPGYWDDFGRQMAALHNYTNDEFGFPHDNYIGSTPQLNQWMKDGYLFFTQCRLIFQAEMAVNRKLLTDQEVKWVENLAERLKELVPEQPASLIHGDLWGGNAMTDENGYPSIIDPAAHYGWAEADLAMTALFGGFDNRFYDAYNEYRPLPLGWQDRFDIYNLYHLLNHLNLFGRGYHGQVMRILKRYR
ncbi:MAG: fructosamine kinase family protein [Anaerolineales bacterium]|jgi:fructosamine-3-kinase